MWTQYYIYVCLKLGTPIYSWIRPSKLGNTIKELMDNIIESNHFIQGNINYQVNTVNVIIYDEYILTPWMSEYILPLKNIGLKM